MQHLLNSRGALVLIGGVSADDCDNAGIQDAMNSFWFFHIWDIWMIVLAATFPSPELARGADPGLARVETRHDFPERDLVEPILFTEFKRHGTESLRLRFILTNAGGSSRRLRE